MEEQIQRLIEKAIGLRRYFVFEGPGANSARAEAPDTFEVRDGLLLWDEGSVRIATITGCWLGGITEKA